MGSARTVCPECDSTTAVVDLGDLLYSARVDYFRCRACGCWWMVAKDADELSVRIVFGHAKSPVNAKKAG